VEPLNFQGAARPPHMAAIVPWVRIVYVGSSGAEVEAWVIEGPGLPDLATVDAVARWHLSARRCGGSILLRDVSPDLSALLDFVGLLGEVGGEPEGRKQVLGVEEDMEPGDPIA
jgi:hypothetical protein